MSFGARIRSVSWLLAGSIVVAGSSASCMLVTGVGDLKKGDCEGDCEDGGAGADGSVSDAKGDSHPADASVDTSSNDAGPDVSEDDAGDADDSSVISDAAEEADAGNGTPVPCTASSAECPNCVDGFCCDTPCGGGATDDCQACSKAAGASADGKCGTVKAGRVCRPANGVCDVDDVCDGTSTTCTPKFDSIKACRPAAGACDIAEKCDGKGPDCPKDAVQAQGVSCRIAAGPCDLEEKCDGTGVACPIDAFVKSGTPCGAATGCTNRIESKSSACTGDQAICPASVRDCAPYDCGTGNQCDSSCSSSSECTLGGQCSGTTCQATCPAGTLFVPGGMFFMGRGAKGSDTCPTGMTCGDDELPEHAFWVSPYCLDTTEVTVGQFRAFYEAYPSWSKPSVGDGAKPNVAGSGWMADWTGKYLPADQAALDSDLSCANGTWTATAGANENLPMTCTDWYTSFAFCIWAQKRLPTEGEWEYAAAGGSENRLYPWGASAPTASSAYFGKTSSAPLVSVGSSPSGNGKWGHKDLAGSVWEWVLDYRYTSGYMQHLDASCSEPGHDCATLIPGTSGYRSMRGGGFNSLADSLRGAYRSNFDPTKSLRNIGFRCAKSL